MLFLRWACYPSKAGIDLPISYDSRKQLKAANIFPSPFLMGRMICHGVA